MYNLNQDNQTEPIQMRKGELLEYKGYVHISVGYWLEYEIADEGVLQLKNSQINYHNPENMRKGMTGGDASTKTLHFEALAVGETELQISKSFRGVIEQQETWKIIVKD
jgi:hypothetical protein